VRAIARRQTRNDRTSGFNCPDMGRPTIESESMSGLTLPPILTIGEAAKYSGLHRDRIAGALNRRELPAVHVESRRFVRPPDLIAWLDAQGLQMMEFGR
jgi:hypothetical protein